MATRTSAAHATTLFYSYAHADERLRDQLSVHLAILRREAVITEWHDRDITAGADWEQAINEHLEAADIILLLVSPDFTNSDYCWGKETIRALERHDAGSGRVIPVIIRPTDWRGAPFGRLEALPKDAKPVTVWKNRDLAWLDVANGIRKAAGEVSRGIVGETQQAPARVRVVNKRGAAPKAAKPVKKAGRAPSDGPRRMIYSAGQGSDFPGKLVRSEGDPPTGDPAVDEAYDGVGLCHEFYLKAFGRKSLDGKGTPIQATVHYERNYDNSFWNGKALIFGDGDGTLFNRFTSSIEVVAHTYAHGVVGSIVELEYWEEPGALMESICDVLGSLVRQYSLGQAADEADWLIGSGLLLPKIKGKGLRSMANPGSAYDDPMLGKDSQPSHMRGFVRTDADSGGVHSNAGIPNRAFYLTATALSGFAWERAGRIWYEALPRLKPRTKFRDFAKATVSSAGRLFGSRGDEAMAVKHSWEMVGVKVPQ
jgi:hypothetical protein